MDLKWLILVAFAAVVLVQVVGCEEEETETAEAPAATEASETEAPANGNGEDPLLECIKSKVKSVENAQKIENSDVQCHFKYAWVNPPARASDFNATKLNYTHAFDIEEPVPGSVQIDPSCRTLSEKSDGDESFMTTWYCLNYCEGECRDRNPISTPNRFVYPVRGVTCKHGELGKGCAEVRTCACQCRDNRAVEPITATMGEILSTYKDFCLNCVFHPTNSGFRNPINYMNFCMNGMSWSQLVSEHAVKNAFQNFLIKWRQMRGSAAVNNFH